MAESEGRQVKVVLGPKLKETLRGTENSPKLERDLRELEVEVELVRPLPADYHRPTTPKGPPPWPPPPPLGVNWKVTRR